MNSLPSSMRFIDITAPGAPEVMHIATGTIPTPGPGEVLIQVQASGVNRPDIFQRMGKYPPPADASPILGLEVAGFIVNCHESVTTYQVGDTVCALVPGGGYAEYCLAPAEQCLPIPSGITAIEAAGLPETFFTVWFNVFMRGKLKQGEIILIHGGAGGIGTTAIQLAKAFGAHVVVTAGSEQKCEKCLTLGADAAINYRTRDFLREILQLTENHGADLILDMVGGTYVERNLKALAVNGRLVQIAFMEGSRIELDLRALLMKRLTLTGSLLRPLPISEKAEIAAQLKQQVWPLLQNGAIKPVIDQTFKLEEAFMAHQRMESNKHIGKIMLLP